MKKLFFFIFIICISPSLSAQNQNETILALEILEGKWYINQSNFPMWLKGNKTNPSFNYTVEEKKGVLGLKDEVIFIKNGQKKSILVFDTPKNKSNTKFVWKGKGFLALLKSKWAILYLDEEENWAIIHFEKTLFTPEGYDVISRDKVLTNQLEQNIYSILKALNIDEKLTPIKQD